MIVNWGRRVLSAVLSFALVVSSSQFLYGFQAPANGNGNPTEAAPMSASALQSLVAPIALYPDALVAQILTASTFPTSSPSLATGTNRTRV
jgi:hypothetical protein